MGAWPELLGALALPVEVSTYSLHSLGGLGGVNIGASAVWPAANRALLVPCRFATPFRVTRLKLFNGAAVSGNFDIGIYNLAGKRLVSAGSTAQAGTNAAQVVVLGTPVLLAPGTYYVALVFDNTTATNFRSAPATLELARTLGMAKADLGSVTLPDPITPATVTDAYIPLVALESRGF